MFFKSYYNRSVKDSPLSLHAFMIRPLSTHNNSPNHFPPFADFWAVQYFGCGYNPKYIHNISLINNYSIHTLQSDLPIIHRILWHNLLALKGKQIPSNKDITYRSTKYKYSNFLYVTQGKQLLLILWVFDIFHNCSIIVYLLYILCSFNHMHVICPD